eukprot:4845863-Alexandrium_andersonii.AAC.1
MEEVDCCWNGRAGLVLLGADGAAGTTCSCSCWGLARRPTTVRRAAPGGHGALHRLEPVGWPDL